MPKGVYARPDPRPLLDRLTDKVIIGDGCWEWAGRHDTRNGYAKFDHSRQDGGRDECAHAVMYKTVVAEVAPGDVVHHLCENKGCVNPDHLVAMPRGEHQTLHHRSDVCKKGLHSMANAYVVPGTGKRVCRICRLDRRRERTKQNKRRFQD